MRRFVFLDSKIQSNPINKPTAFLAEHKALMSLLGQTGGICHIRDQQELDVIYLVCFHWVCTELPPRTQQETSRCVPGCCLPKIHLLRCSALDRADTGSVTPLFLTQTHNYCIAHSVITENKQTLCNNRCCHPQNGHRVTLKQDHPYSLFVTTP